MIIRNTMVTEMSNSQMRGKLRSLLQSDPDLLHHMISQNEDEYSHSTQPARHSNGSFTSVSGASSPYMMSPWNAMSPYTKSPWIIQSDITNMHEVYDQNGLVGSLVREEGHIYSLATNGELLYTGSDSKNVRVWKNLKDFSGFKSNSGLVKAIVIVGDKVFTGHQDGKIRVWKASSRNSQVHKRVGSLPKFKDTLKSSINPRNYVEVRRNHSVLKIKHFDAVSCMSLNEQLGLLYSGSWDKTFKVWRISDSKCLESVNAHDDALNSIAVGFDSLVFTGSADGKVKMWRRELQGKRTKHFLVSVLLDQEYAVTSLAVNKDSAVVYSGSSDGLVNYWEREKHLTHGGVLEGHRMAVLCLATAGKLVFSGSADGNICVWRRDGNGVHSCLALLTGHTGPVKCLAVEKESEREKGEQIVYSGSLDKSVKAWRVCENSPMLRMQGC